MFKKIAEDVLSTKLVFNPKGKNLYLCDGTVHAGVMGDDCKTMWGDFKVGDLVLINYKDELFQISVAINHEKFSSMILGLGDATDLVPEKELKEITSHIKVQVIKSYQDIQGYNTMSSSDDGNNPMNELFIANTKEEAINYVVHNFVEFMKDQQPIDKSKLS